MNKHDSRPGYPTQSTQDQASLKEFEDASHKENEDASHEEHEDTRHEEHGDTRHGEHGDTGYEKGGSVEDFTYSLRGMEFPAEKTALVEHVRQHSANDVVMGRLNKIEDRVYDSITDVTNQIGKAA